MFDNGTYIKELPPVPADASEFEKATALFSILYYGNGTEVMNYRNGTVALFLNGKFQSYLVPPKSFFITMTLV